MWGWETCIMPKERSEMPTKFPSTVKESASMEHIGIYRRIILQQILKHRVGRSGLDSPSFVHGPAAVHLFIYC